MTARTRYFVIGGTLVLVAGLAVGLVAYYVARPGGLSSRTSAPELRYVPQNATAVAYANVHDVMSSNFRQRVLKVEPDEQGRREFEQRTGIDIEHDVDRIVACLAPATAASQDEAGRDRPQGLLLAAGRFDQQKIDGLAREHGATMEQYEGVSIAVHAMGDDDAKAHNTLALAFLDRGLVALGSEPLVKQAIDLHSGHGTSVLANAELMGLVHEESGSDTAWAVGRFDALAAHGHLPADITSRIPPITWVSVAGHVNDTVEGTVKAETRDQQSADNLRQVVQGLLALARMQVNAQPDL
ncbi:MAG TPA: hypothetical protein VIC33_12320, partial [Vicinamibacterales bacterium]